MGVLEINGSPLSRTSKPNNKQHLNPEPAPPRGNEVDAHPVSAGVSFFLLKIRHSCEVSGRVRGWPPWARRWRIASAYGLFAATDDEHAYGHFDMARAYVIAVSPEPAVADVFLAFLKVEQIEHRLLGTLQEIRVFQEVIFGLIFSMLCEKRCQQEGLSASGFFRRNMNSRTLFARVICCKVLIISKISLANIDKYKNTYLLDSGK